MREEGERPSWTSQAFSSGEHLAASFNLLVLQSRLTPVMLLTVLLGLAPVLNLPVETPGKQPGQGLKSVEGSCPVAFSLNEDVNR